MLKIRSMTKFESLQNFQMIGLIVHICNRLRYVPFWAECQYHSRLADAEIRQKY